MFCFVLDAVQIFECSGNRNTLYLSTWPACLKVGHPCFIKIMYYMKYILEFYFPRFQFSKCRSKSTFCSISCSIDKVDSPSLSCNMRNKCMFWSFLAWKIFFPRCFLSLYRDVTSTRRWFYIAQASGICGKLFPCISPMQFYHKI
jgi:hypothetical protein